MLTRCFLQSIASTPFKLRVVIANWGIIVNIRMKRIGTEPPQWFEDMNKERLIGESVMASGVHFPDHLRITYDRENSIHGPASSRTRGKRQVPDSMGTIEHIVPQYDADGVLTESSGLSDIRWGESDVEFEVGGKWVNISAIPLGWYLLTSFYNGVMKQDVQHVHLEAIKRKPSPADVVKTMEDLGVFRHRDEVDLKNKRIQSYDRQVHACLKSLAKDWDRWMSGLEEAKAKENARG